MLDVLDLHAGYGNVPVLTGISFTVAEGVAGTGALETSVLAGTILQGSSVGATGVAADLLAYTFEPSEFTLTHATGDATNPRIDVVEVKLETITADSTSRDFEDAVTEALTTTSVDKTRRTQITIQIKQGTPAASPGFPALTAGFVGLGAVLVPALHAGVFVAETHLSDLRIPLGVKRSVTYAESMVADGTAWTKAGDAASGFALEAWAMTGPAGPASLYVRSPLGSHQRLVGIAFSGSLDYSALDLELVRIDIPVGGQELAVIAELEPFVTSSASNVLHQIDMVEIYPAIATATGNAKNGSGLGHGIWGNGRLCGSATEDAVLATFDTNGLALHVNPTAGIGDIFRINAVYWFYAEGLV
jgi:hypothetical protein